MTYRDWSGIAVGTIFGLLIAALLHLAYYAMQCPPAWIP
jgi:hypothetical protein